jgi:hypothetical protein
MDPTTWFAFGVCLYHPSSPQGLLLKTQPGFVGLAHDQGKDIVFRFILEYSSSLRDFGP